MFGYRLVHKDILNALLARVNPPAVVTASVGGGVVMPTSSATAHSAFVHAEPAAPTLPPDVEDAVSAWDRWSQPMARQQALDWLAAGIDPAEVARRVAQGESVED